MTAIVTDTGWLRFANTDARCLAAAALSIAVLFAILAYIGGKGLSSISWSFLTRLPAPVGEEGGGIANAIVGSAIWALMLVIVGVTSGSPGLSKGRSLRRPPPPAAVVGLPPGSVGSASGVGDANGVSVAMGVGGSGVLLGTAATVCAIIVLAAAIADACTCSGLTVGTAGAQALNSTAMAVGTNRIRCMGILSIQPQALDEPRRLRILYPRPRRAKKERANCPLRKLSLRSPHYGGVSLILSYPMSNVHLSGLLRQKPPPLTVVLCLGSLIQA